MPTLPQLPIFPRWGRPGQVVRPLWAMLIVLVTLFSHAIACGADMKIGRNDPCPCGSGLKYKKRCADKQEPGGQSTGAGKVMGELRELFKGQGFASRNEANAFLRKHMQKRNQDAVDDFHGLSPEKMHRFLHFPFDTPELVAFPSCLDIKPEAPIISLQPAGRRHRRAGAQGDRHRQSPPQLLSGIGPCLPG